MSKFKLHKENYLASIKYDLPSGLVVFLVALPLCLGIALASGAPLFAGIIAGIVGGLVVPLISQSQVSVSGPAAGLTAIILFGIEELGSFEAMLLAIFFSGFIQILLGFIKAGYIAYFFPSSIIKGMLSAIGLILILKQIPHAIGFDMEAFGSDEFDSYGSNTFTVLLDAYDQMEWGAVIISVISVSILIIWEKTSLKNFRWVPAALVVVVLSIFLNMILAQISPTLTLYKAHLVALPRIENFSDFLYGFNTPDWTLMNSDSLVKVGKVALTIGIIASVETLLTIEAVDKLDPFKRKTPLNRELIAQGVANSISGLIGGIPITSVIVRGSANISAGARTKVSAFFHGVLLLLSVLFLSRLLNLIPLASLASVLLVIGYKLARPSLIKKMYQKGSDQFLPFIITILAILFTNLLIGISIGIVAGLIFVIRANFHVPFTVTNKLGITMISFNRDITFLNKAVLIDTLESIDENTHLIINGAKAQFIDQDIIELLEEFEQEAKLKHISIKFEKMGRVQFSKSLLGTLAK